MSFITNLYDYYITEYQDPRIEGYPLMDSPRTTILLCSLYLIFVKYIGPAYMKNREPLQLRRTLIAYNAFQTLFSLNIFLQASWYGLPQIEQIYCTPHRHRTDWLALKVVNLAWWFFIGRFIEFLDTIFFILRKKNNQVTSLHVLHHFLVPIDSWVGAKIVPGSHYNIGGLINSFVHTIMYLYYMIAAMGPEYKKYLWWKKYLTILQLTQFILIILHTVATLISGCDIPQFMGWLILSQAVLFLSLFWNFYKQSFQEKHEKKPKEASKQFFDNEKYYNKFRALYEMCILNQHVLYNEDENIQPEQKQENALDISDEHHKKKK